MGDYMTEALKAAPWQRQEGTVLSRRKATPITFWCRLSYEEEGTYEGNKRVKRLVPQINVDVLTETDKAHEVNGVAVRGSITFRRYYDGEVKRFRLSCRNYYLQRAKPDGGYLGGSLPDKAASAVREAMEGVVDRLFDDPLWMARELVYLRAQEVKRAIGKVEEAEKELKDRKKEKEAADKALDKAVEALEKLQKKVK